MSAVRVLIVDDSATMQGLIAATLKRDPAIEVIGTASNAAEARQAIKQFNPDVLTLDVEMPNMSGIEFLDKIMRLRPMPVVMVSTLTARGTETAIEALQIGAVDCVVKPYPGHENSFDELPDKVKIAAKVRVKARTADGHGAAAATSAAPSDYRPGNKIVAIGSSTGGVEALIGVVGRLPANCPPVIITQHMPEHFTATFANRLDRLCAPKVCEASDGLPLKPGNVYLAPGGEAHLEIFGGQQLCCCLRRGDKLNGHRPSVDALFQSVAKHAGARAVGVILTGMGRDGADGLLAMRKAGARTLGQNEESSIVYGMPKVAFDIGAVERQLPLARIGPEIVALTAAGKN